MDFTLHTGDCLTVLQEMDENSVDTVITDPPAGIAFMGKDWDKDKGGRDNWIAWMTDVMRECLRVLKPGGHIVVWALPRTSHWTATAIEDAGFEIRDRIHVFKDRDTDVDNFLNSLSPDQRQALDIILESHGRNSIYYHLFASGFPKSHDISKAIDRQAVVTCPECNGEGVVFTPDQTYIGLCEQCETEDGQGVWHRVDPDAPVCPDCNSPITDIKEQEFPIPCPQCNGSGEIKGAEREVRGDGRGHTNKQGDTYGKFAGEYNITTPATPEAEKWEGWGTALSPSVEHWIMAMKPRDGTFAENALNWGVSGLWIDGARIATTGDDKEQHLREWNRNQSVAAEQSVAMGSGLKPIDLSSYRKDGRWPKNAVFQHHPDCVPLGTKKVKGDSRGECNGERPGGFGDVGADNGDSEPNARVYGNETVTDWDCHPDCPVRQLAEQSGESKSVATPRNRNPREDRTQWRNGGAMYNETQEYSDEGTAARFFYCAKASRSERDRGLEEFEHKYKLRDDLTEQEKEYVMSELQRLKLV